MSCVIFVIFGSGTSFHFQGIESLVDKVEPKPKIFCVPSAQLGWCVFQSGVRASSPQQPITVFRRTFISRAPNPICEIWTKIEYVASRSDMKIGVISTALDLCPLIYNPWESKNIL